MEQLSLFEGGMSFYTERVYPNGEKMKRPDGKPNMQFIGQQEWKYPQKASSSATPVADVVIKKSALTSQAFQILNYLDFFEYDAVGYPNYCDYEDFERYTNTLCCQGTFDYERKNIADDAAYELLSAVAKIPEKERKLFFEFTTDWYQYYKYWCENNNIQPISYNDFDWGYRKLYLPKILQRKDFTES